MFNESYNGTTSSRSQFHYMEMGSYTNTQLSNMQAGFKFMFESNVPINFIYDNQHDNYLTSLGISSTTYRVYEYVLIDNKEYPVGTMFIGNDGSYQGNMEITFDVTKIDKSATYAEGEYIIGKTIQATISIRDFNKYAYQYSYDEKEWYSFKKDEWVLDPVRQEFKFTENGVLHVRVINKETNEVEKSGSFVVDGISHFAKDDVIYHSYIKIPLSDLYDSENGFWKNKSFIFMSYNADKIKPTRLEYYFELRPKDNVDDNKKIPLMVYFNKDIVDIREYSKKIASSPTTDPDGYGGGFTLGAGQGGGGGGGGRFDEDDNFIGCTNFPLVYNDELITTKHYATITISLNSCANISGKTPNDFSTDSIYVFYNGRYYDDVIDAVEDNLNSGSKLLGPFLNLINKKLPIVYQIGEIINSFKYDKSQLKKPSLMIDFTKVGLNFKYEFFSDDFLNAYDKYRDILYFFIYLSVGFIVVPKVIGYVKGYFGGGNE